MFLNNTMNSYQLPKQEVSDAVCVDVIDLGYLDTEWGMKQKVEFVFEINQLRESGYRHTLRKRSNVCFHEKANLSKDLTSWFGRNLPVQDQNVAGLKSLKGKTCRVEIKHNKAGERVYANIVSIL